MPRVAPSTPSIAVSERHVNDKTLITPLINRIFFFSVPDVHSVSSWATARATIPVSWHEHTEERKKKISIKNRSVKWHPNEGMHRKAQQWSIDWQDRVSGSSDATQQPSCCFDAERSSILVQTLESDNVNCYLGRFWANLDSCVFGRREKQKQTKKTTCHE